MPNRRATTAALALLALAACSSARPAAPPPDAPAPADLPGIFRKVGRGPVTETRVTGLTVFRGVDGRDYAYAGTFGFCEECEGGDRVLVWDVTDPSSPVLTDSVMVDARLVYDVAVNEGATMAAVTREGAESLRNGIVLLDLSDPAHPTRLGEYWETLTGGVRGVELVGDHAYVVDSGTNNLVVLDVSDPTDVRKVAEWGTPVRPGKYLNDVTVQDGLAYLGYWDDGLVVLDVGRGIDGGSPEEPELVSQFRYRTEWRGSRYGNTHYALPYTNRAGNRYVFVGDEIIPPNADLEQPVPTGGILHVLDFSDPERPLEVASYEVPGHGVHYFDVADDTLYLAAYGGGVRALDVSGTLRGDLRRREIAAVSTSAPEGEAYRADLPFAWEALHYRGNVLASDFNSGLWIFRLVDNPAAGAAPAAEPEAVEGR